MADQHLDEQTIQQLAEIAQRAQETPPTTDNDDLDETETTTHMVALSKYNKEREKSKELKSALEDTKAQLFQIEQERLEEKNLLIKNQRERDLKAGEFSKVIDSLKAENEALQGEIENAKAESIRLKIGREFNLPDEVSELLRGTDPEIIRHNAQKVANAMPKQSGFVDGSVGSNAVLQSNNTPHYPELEGGAF